MPQVTVNDISIEYEITGPGDGDPMLLIMGLGAQLTAWPMPVREALAGHGYRVICFDHRDCGLSTHMGEAGLPDFDLIEEALEKDMPPPIAYGFDDMARDALGLLDALGVGKAHIVGASMGGMIGQIFAADYPDRTLSLTAMMAPTTVPKPDIASMNAMIAPLAPGVTLDMLATMAATFLLPFSSPAYPESLESLAERLLEGYLRSYYPEGMVRHTAAAYADVSRAAKLSAIRAPTLILHGEADQLAPVAGAGETASAIRDAWFRTIPGWGHDMPDELVPALTKSIAENAARAHASA
jgi:pimeloyl-ACP methyl ester carboxylesterase